MADPRFLRDERGTTAVEFAFVSLFLLLTTFGIIDFGLMLWQWNIAEKATQVGVRTAVVSNFVAPNLATFPSAPTSPPGTGCSDATGAIIADCDFAPVTCTSGGCSAFGFDNNAFTWIVQAMQQIDPFITPANVQVTYSPNGLGFVGRPGGLPMTVTVQLIGMQFNFFVIGALIGQNGPFAMPNFTATLIGEDMSTNST